MTRKIDIKKERRAGRKEERIKNAIDSIETIKNGAGMYVIRRNNNLDAEAQLDNIKHNEALRKAYVDMKKEIEILKKEGVAVLIEHRDYYIDMYIKPLIDEDTATIHLLHKYDISDTNIEDVFVEFFKTIDEVINEQRAWLHSLLETDDDDEIEQILKSRKEIRELKEMNRMLMEKISYLERENSRLEKEIYEMDN